jgi:hypothetical protein
MKSMKTIGKNLFDKLRFAFTLEVILVTLCVWGALVGAGIIFFKDA